jgi:hypothetical protein
VVFVLCTLFVALAVSLSSGALIDDAYIAIRYSVRLANGHGLTFQDGPAVEGYSCFSWVLLGALFEKLGVSSVVSLPLLGIGCGAATVAVVARAAQRWSASAAAGVVPGLFLVSPGLAYYAGSGLETALYALLVALALVASLEGRPIATAVACALALLTRPEAAGLIALTLSIGVVRAASAQRRAWYAAGACVFVVAALYAAFKWSYFGALLPNTAIAKAPVLDQGFSYVGLCLIDPSLLLGLASVLLVRRARVMPRHLLCLGVAAVLVVGTIAEGGDWMPGNRLLLPAMVAVAPALDVLRVALVQASRGLRVGLGLAAVLGVALFSYGSAFDANLFAMTSESTARYEPLRDDVARAMQKSGVRSVGTLDIGRISYAVPELQLFDLGGLTDREVARLPGDYRSKQLPEALLQQRAPDAFLFTASSVASDGSDLPRAEFHYPVEAGIEASTWFRQRYRLQGALRIAGDYYLCWYGPAPRATP